MNKLFIAMTLSFALSTGVALAAPADQVTPPEQVAAQPQGMTTEDKAFKAFENDTNPNVSVPTTGIYDERDRYIGPTGYPLPGYGRLPPS